jgi:NAD(P)-dependent dehydrogenase (short-subunit alcohol dehydrogenase family)
MQSLGPDNSPSLESLFSLKGKVALVIGGAGFLGKEISAGLAELGANIVIASRNLRNNEDFAELLSQRFVNINVKSYEVDITNDESVRQLMSHIDENWPDGLDILVNCGWSGRKNDFNSISMDDWKNDLDVCLTGVFRTIKLAMPLLAKKKGNVLNIASMYGHVAPDYRLYDSEKYANPPSYGAAKAGIIQLTKYLSSFLSPQGIRVNCISPGPFPFPQTQLENPEFMKRLSDKNPMNRLGNPYEIKGAATLLCSSAGSFMTGQNICIDGGWSVW